MFGLEDSRRYYVCQRYVRMNLGIWTTISPSVSIAIYPSPDATRSSSDRIRVQSVEPCSIHLPARAACRTSASSSTYRTSSTRLRHCHLTLLLRNTETCYPINGNWPTNQARCYCGYFQHLRNDIPALVERYFAAYKNHCILLPQVFTTIA